MNPTNSNPPIEKNLSPLNVSYTVVGRGILQNDGYAQRKKIAIVGFEEQNIRTAPYDNPTWEIWSLNMANRLGFMHDAQGRFRADRWFDLHEEHPQSALDMAWIHACPVPIYLPIKFSENLNALAYPLADVECWLHREFGLDHPYWASSFAYMVALAMYEGAETIGLFGVNLGWGRERIVERGNLEFYLGLAMGRGIRVEYSPDTKLLTHPARYGFEYDAERNQVIEDCATVTRQLAQGKEFKLALDFEFQERIEAFDAIRQEIASGLWNLAHASREQLREKFSMIDKMNPAPVNTEEDETRI